MGDWYTIELPDGPGIYRWTIEPPDGPPQVYIGKARRLSLRLRQYIKNVENLRGGRDYRKGDPTGFRVVHVALAEAVEKRHKVTLSIVEACAEEDLSTREAYWIAKSGTLNGTVAKSPPPA